VTELTAYAIRISPRAEHDIAAAGAEGPTVFILPVRHATQAAATAEMLSEYL